MSADSLPASEPASQPAPGPHAAQDQPSAWVLRFAPLIPSGEVLDLACGGGRHARLLAALGHPVLAVDRDAEALARAAQEGIVTWQVDLEGTDEAPAAWPFPAAAFAGVVVTNYLHRPLFPGILDCLAPGGVLIYETFATGNEQFGRPSSPRFLLQPGELLEMARDSELRVIAYEDGYVDAPKPAMVQRICVMKAAPGQPATALRIDGRAG
ncbi:class I SAM-dependent methyltransferase [Noviherbaspirillum galbum]|uniref:Methyltransferase domain-containing protein n=1 Tax=Noviherbaspirillum galbum TaxID=2709383 RepID=A0A6B3SMI2_9BURK|nr:methyltransferase domain-containing protein [Noviherbaspirillum galbum]NEX59916.1 methyltransferase domain-containing protein [Noviherbaspirillum galbum]